MKPAIRHRYRENQPIALHTLCIIVSILITSNHLFFSQLLRLRRICLHFSNYLHHVKILNQCRFSRDYPCKLISEKINRATHITQTKYLTCQTNDKTNENRITFITQLHLSISTFLTKVNKDWLNIHTDNRFNNKLSSPIILANKQPLNLQQLHTHSKNTILQRNQPFQKPRCEVCSHFDTRCSVKFDNNVTISAAKADCNSQNVVYILFCAECPNAVYLGETSKRFRFRLDNRKHRIKHNLPGYPVTMHFSEQSHTIEDLRYITIRNHVHDTDNRKLIEQKTIIKLNTHITGRDKDRDFFISL